MQGWIQNVTGKLPTVVEDRGGLICSSFGVIAKDTRRAARVWRRTADVCGVNGVLLD